MHTYNIGININSTRTHTHTHTQRERERERERERSTHPSTVHLGHDGKFTLVMPEVDVTVDELISFVVYAQGLIPRLFVGCRVWGTDANGGSHSSRLSKFKCNMKKNGQRINQKNCRCI